MSLPFSRIDIIYNPNSTGDAPEKAEWLAAELGKKLKNISILVHKTKHAGHAIDIAAELTGKYGNPLLISVSGDGGYHEVVNGALKAVKKNGLQPVCAVYAAGNANDYRNATKRRSLVKAISEGNVSTMDVLKIIVKDKNVKQTACRYGHSYAGLGITPKVAVELNKHELNSLLEKMLVARTFWNFKPFPVEHDGVTKLYDSLIFANIPRMAKVLKLSDDSQQNDGKFEVIAQPHRGKLSLLAHGLKAALFGLKNQPKYREFVFSVPNKTDMQVDGEVVGLPAHASVRVKVMPRQLFTIY